jgi:hypothetical protein
MKQVLLSRRKRQNKTELKTTNGKPSKSYNKHLTRIRSRRNWSRRRRRRRPNWSRKQLIFPWISLSTQMMTPKM